MLGWKIRILKLHLFKKGTIFHVLSRLSVVLSINFSLRLENSLKLKEISSPSVSESISNYQVTDGWLKKNWSPCKEREAMSLRPHGLCSPWNSPGQNTGVGSLSLLQGIFPTKGLNPGLPHFGWILYQLSHQASPRILEWVAILFSRESSQPRD